MKGSEGGRLLCVGVGLQVGFQTSIAVEEHLKAADIIYYAISDEVGCNWVENLNDNCVNLAQYYQMTDFRTESYKMMVEAILDSVRKGLSVCCAFYGHPGVFAYAPNKAIAQARAEGYSATMLPGISAADCLYADLGVDPGRLGCIHYEATQFMINERVVDKSSYLILWQIGVVGDRESKHLKTSQQKIELFKLKLLQFFSENQELIVYEAAVYPFMEYSMKILKLHELKIDFISLESTLVIPPSEKLKKDTIMLQKLSKLR